MTVVKIISTNTFVFITVLFLSAIIISIYMALSPEKSVPYNFDPFPSETPSALPDPTHPTDNCWNKLTPCDSAGNCSACSLGEYSCVNVSKEQADAKFYHYNGINVPEGNWCLPKDNNPNPICNMYTGRWLWTFDPEYCGSIGAGQQCWKCDCLYPSLFSGSAEGCNTPIACQNDSIFSQSIIQPDNKLVGTQYAKKTVQGCVWNPTSQVNKEGYEKEPSSPSVLSPSLRDGVANASSSVPSEIANASSSVPSEIANASSSVPSEIANASSSVPSEIANASSSVPSDNCPDVYQYSPYDKDSNGNPWFSCACNDNSSGQYFSQLPGDPQTCHLEPCFASKNYRQKGIKCENGSCSCECDVAGTNFAKAESGKFAGTCVLIQDSCGAFGWDGNNKTCACGEGPFWQRKCRSPSTGVNVDNTSLPLCTQETNTLGSECVNFCAGKTCNNSAPCMSCGPNSFDQGIQQCGVNDDGTLMANPKVPHAVCDCALATPPYDPTGKSNYGGYYGPSCSMLCLKGGTVISSSFLGKHSSNSSPCACCCSQSSSTSNDFWSFGSTETCNDGFASGDQPAQADCLPLPDSSCPDQNV